MQTTATSNAPNEARSERAPKPENPAHPVSGSIAPLPRPSWLPESVWPFATSQLAYNGSRIAFTDVGRGPVLLFVHTGQWSFLWRDVITRLSLDFRCVTLDAPGTGQSSRVPPREITLKNSADAVLALIRALDLRDITLAVHDLGGPAGLAAAAEAPDRIRGIAAINTFAWRPTSPAFRGMLALVGSSFFREFDALTEFVPRISSSAFGVARHLDTPGRQAFRAGMKRGGIRAFHYYIHDALKADALYEKVAAALAGPFRALPLLTIFGERNDPLGFQPRWKTLFPHARQIVVARGNHYPMCDDPDLVARTIREWHREFVVAEITGR